ncbi:DUF262 domain-containing protein [Flavobacterium sp. YJ01]|uniref:DUF262 domain-containing protein n=1 Tax=Flavobacterium sp. YJ01 TaxID=3031997 RepID=UPI0023E3F829|nr:DUF262 domain-containing protein [Flavobacterium sp. YJ01]WET03929.1 DUF262 domain-containing protein [Flavobacterium sp. YJ01]
MDGIKAEIKKVDDIIIQNLNIPEYQRPYRWGNKQVTQLLEDVYASWKQQKKTYRIGSIILFENDALLDIVDGQQRITTIILTLLQLSDNSPVPLSSTLKYNNVDSKNAIIANSDYIAYWIDEHVADQKPEFFNYIIQSCEFVEVKVSSHSEAFQMFDSQNSRGKELEAYNLLKAYHIRAMEEEKQEVKIKCDQRWENATRHALKQNNTMDILKQLFNEQLYRPRLWSRKEEAFQLNKNNLHEFKGTAFSSDQSVKHPFQNKDFLLDYALGHLEKNNLKLQAVKERFESLRLENVNQFVSINENIVNGKAFFGYIETYTEIYKQLFIYLDDTTSAAEFKEFYKTFVDHTHNRKGDLYLKELYKSLIFFLFDKYGEDGLLRYYKLLYVIVYRVRLEKKQVKYNDVMKYALMQQLFFTIDKSKNYSDLKDLQIMMLRPIDCRKEISYVLKAMFSFNITISTKDKNINLSRYKK